MNKQLNLQNLPCPDIHKSIRTQWIMTEEWRGQNLRKTVGEYEKEVGRHKHMHEMRQCSSVLLVGDGCYSPSVVSPFTSGRLVVCLRSFSFSADSSSFQRLSLCLSSECVTLQSCRWSDLLHTLSCWCELVDFVPSLLTLTIHTLTLSLSLSRSHGSSLPIHSQSLWSPLAPPPSLSLSCSLSLVLPLTSQTQSGYRGPQLDSSLHLSLFLFLPLSLAVWVAVAECESGRLGSSLWEWELPWEK